MSEGSSFLLGLAVAGAFAIIGISTVRSGTMLGAEIKHSREMTAVVDEVRSVMGNHNGDARERAIAVRDRLVEKKSPYIRKTILAIEEGDRCWANARDIVDLVELVYANDCAVGHYRQAEVLGAAGSVWVSGGAWPTNEL